MTRSAWFAIGLGIVVVVAVGGGRAFAQALPDFGAELPPPWIRWTPALDAPAVSVPQPEAPEPGEEDEGRPRPRTALPPVEPAPAVAPVIRDEPLPPPAVVAAPARPLLVVRIILGLTLFVALAFAASQPAVERLERRLRIAQIVTAGLPFVLLGMIARLPTVGVLNDDVLGQLSPVLRIALGWIGFVVGFRLDARRLAGLDEGTAGSAGLFMAVPFALVFAATAVVLVGGSGPLRESFADPVFLRDALVIGTAASMAASTLPRLLPASSREALRSQTTTVVRVEELAGIIGLALVAAYFRPEGEAVGWQLPGTGWLFVTVGAGALLGFLFLALLNSARESREFTVLALGCVSFAAGLAGYLHLSSVTVCFVAAALLANLPGAHQDRLRRVLDALERPLYLILLVILGALWPTRSVVGWVLIPVFVSARMAGRWLAARAAERARFLELGPTELQVFAAAPVGSLAIAIVVNAQLLYPGGFIADAVVAVVGGSLITEGVLHALILRSRRREGAR